MSDKILYDADGAADVLSTSKRRIHELRRAGLLLAVDDGRVKKFTRDELERYAESLQSSEPRSA